MHFYAWRLVTFEPLIVEQSYIPHLKALMCGNKASEAPWRSNTLRVCQALLKSAVLLSKTTKRLTFIFENCVGWEKLFRLVPKICYCKKSTFFIQSSWYLMSNITYSWAGYFENEKWQDKNFIFSTYRQFSGQSHFLKHTLMK